jgi:hypothetical protein
VRSTSVIVRLVSPTKMTAVAGLDTPRRFYRVLDHPAPLAGMAYPRSSPWQDLTLEGYRSVVCLTDATPRYDPTPLDVLRAAKFKDLDGRKWPDDPAREQAALRDIVAAIESELRAGRGVVVHCDGEQHDLEQVRALLGHTRIDTTQIYATIRPVQLKRAVAFYEDRAARLLSG